MIITCKKQVPARWIIFSILPWASLTYTWDVLGVVFLFSLKKFVENPAGLTFILSLPAFSSILIDPCASFISDRIWTRFGRRKPFLVASWIGIISSLVLMPLMPNFWALLAVYLCYNFFSDLNSPLEPLKQEIIPPHERGRATGAMQWVRNVANITFYVVALGRFDDVTYMAGIPFFGEEMIYWSAAVLVSVMLLLLALGIKEVDQKSGLRGQRLSIHNFFGGLLDRELWPVYLLVFGSAALNAGMGPLGLLLYTDQWAYTKQEMGANVAIGGVLNLFIIGFLTIFADRLNRMRAYRTLICLSVAINFLYFCYVIFVLPDQRPTLVELILFGEIGSIIGILTTMVYVPLVYDYVRRNKMGTYAAGANMVTKVTRLLTLNGVGLFIWGYATIFAPPAGEMARVVMSGEPGQREEVRSLLRALPWTFPQTGKTARPSDIEAIAWQSNGTVSNVGRCWEVRLRNPDSRTLAGEKEALEKERAPLIARQQLGRDRLEVFSRQGKTPEAASLASKISREKVQIDDLNARINGLATTLQSRANQFKEQVTQALGTRLLANGEQILGAKSVEALIVELSTAQRPNIHALEKSLGDLRRGNSKLIDLRPLKLESGYGIGISAILDPGEDADALARELHSAVEHAASRRQHGLFIPGTPILSSSRQPVLVMELLVLEAPLESKVSPVTRAVNALLAWFDAEPAPDRKLSATARNLRTPGEINHVRVDPGTRPNTIVVTAVIPESAPKAASPDDPIGLRLTSLLAANADSGRISQARIFFDRIEEMAAVQRLTVAKPFLGASYSPMKYNYMSGYIWMLILGLIGIAITLVFSRFEAKGLIRKRGVEEAESAL